MFLTYTMISVEKIKQFEEELISSGWVKRESQFSPHQPMLNTTIGTQYDKDNRRVILFRKYTSTLDLWYVVLAVDDQTISSLPNSDSRAVFHMCFPIPESIEQLEEYFAGKLPEPYKMLP